MFYLESRQEPVAASTSKGLFPEILDLELEAPFNRGGDPAVSVEIPSPLCSSNSETPSPIES